MSNDLSTNVQSGFDLIEGSGKVVDQLAEVKEKIKSGKYPGYLKLLAPNAGDVGEGIMEAGGYGFYNSEAKISLGKSFLGIVCAYRSTAMKLINGQLEDVSYDIHSDKYQEFEELAAAGGMNGFLEGPEFFIYVPKAGNFATYHMNTASAKRIAGTLSNAITTHPETGEDLPAGRFVPRPFEFSSRYVKDYKPKGKKESYNFFAPKVAAFKGEIEADVFKAVGEGGDFIKKFLDPPPFVKEESEEPDESVG